MILNMTRQISVDSRTVWGFLALTYGISWGGVTVLHFLDVDPGGGTGQGIGTVVFMGAPAISAFAILSLRRKSIRNSCGLYLGRIRWVILAWLAPAGLTAAMVGIGFTLPDTTFTTEYSAFLLELGFTERDAAETIVDFEATGVPVVVLLGGLGLVLGGTLFALAALGEELGWRGMLLTELAPLGFWKLSVVTGLVWGIWHAPLILLGLQFPDEPVIGIFLLPAATVALAPLYTYLTVRAQSVFAATLFHGSFILGIFTSVYLADGSELMISPFGVVGIGAALAGIAVCVAHDRLLADESITTGEPLRPWSG
jgi:membrane protease YdiL (CAAX protease family)